MEKISPAVQEGELPKVDGAPGRLAGSVSSRLVGDGFLVPAAIGLMLDGPV